jgi:two-component system LytT family response regulator
MLKALIIDDEQRSRELLKTLVTDYCPDVEVTGMADDVPSGVKTIHKLQPDIVFLDIEMPGYSGFQLLDFFEEVDFEIIFTTAYREYAFRAFQVSAIDYLLKPIEIEQLQKAVAKVMEQRKPQHMRERLETLRSNLRDEQISRLALPISDGLLFVDVEDIILLEADRAYTTLFLENGTNVVVSKNIRTFEKILSEHPAFFRAHRSFLINLNRVKRYSRQDGGYIIMDNDKEVSLSKEKREDFLRTFQGLG